MGKVLVKVQNSILKREHQNLSEVSLGDIEEYILQSKMGLSDSQGPLWKSFWLEHEFPVVCPWFKDDRLWLAPVLCYLATLIYERVALHGWKVHMLRNHWGCCQNPDHNSLVGPAIWIFPWNDLGAAGSRTTTLICQGQLYWSLLMFSSSFVMGREWSSMIENIFSDS